MLPHVLGLPLKELLSEGIRLLVLLEPVMPHLVHRLEGAHRLRGLGAAVLNSVTGIGLITLHHLQCRPPNARDQ